MRNVRFNDDVIKHLRALVRDSSKGNEFRNALTKVYQSGYDNGHEDAYRDARQKLQEAVSHANQGASAGDNSDGIVGEPSSTVE